VRSILHPSLREPLRERVRAAWPSAAEDARIRADRIVRGDYDLLGYEGLRFGGSDGAIDWHLDPVSGHRAPSSTFWARVPYLDPSSGDHKVIWELNRHQHWLALGRASWLTGEPRYRARFIAEATGWLAANPPLTGVNWASALELAFRAIAWTWAIELFADETVASEPPWLVDLLTGLDVQLRQIERNLSWYFSPNTHLLGEALALYVCGRTWPELRDGARWARTGGGILLGEIDRQVLPDGVHAERSTHYHRYALDFYLLALVTARLTADHDREGPLAVVAYRMATALRRLTDAAGRVPLIGDDDGGELFPVAGHAPDDVRPTLAWAASLLDRPELATGPAPEAALWLTTATEAASPGRTSPAIPETVSPETSGYHVSRRNDSLLVFDAGAHGFMNAGHAHSDALAITLNAGVHRLLVDPGTGTYTMDPALRDRFRSSQSHNTVTVDGRSQSVPRGPFHWAHAAEGRTEREVRGTTFDFFHATTDAYAPLVHERLVFATGEGSWIVADRLAGEGRHRASVYWHVDPEWTVLLDGHGGWTLTHGTGAEARLMIPDVPVDVFHGDTVPGLGWVAPIYGRLVPAPTLRGTVEHTAPFWLITTIEIGSPRVGVSVSSLADVVSNDAGRSACAVLTRHAQHGELTLFRATREREMVTVELEPRGSMAITTDAAALHARISTAGRLERVCLVDATVCRFDGPTPVTITCPAPIPEVDVRLGDGGPPVLSSAHSLRDLSIWRDRPARGGTPADAPCVVQPLLQQ
jgi:hypothetical protein